MEESRRCTSKAKQSGVRCKNYPLRGAKTCKFHGSATKRSKAKAHRIQIEELIEPSLIKLKDMIEAKGTPPAVLLAAIKDVLDRGGLKAPQVIEIIARETLEAEYERLLAEATDE